MNRQLAIQTLGKASPYFLTRRPCFLGINPRRRGWRARTRGQSVTQPTKSPDNLVKRLRSIARDRALIDVAQFRFIGLAEIERQYGGRWLAARARVHEIAQGFLEENIGESDLLIEGADGFLVVFASKSGTESAIAGIGLSQGLNQFLLGQIGERAPRVNVRLYSTPAAELEASLDALPPGFAPEMSATNKDLSDTIDWRFQPCWDVRREALTSYHVTPYVKASGAPASGYLFEAAAGKANYAAIDEASLHVSEKALKQLLSNGLKCFIGVSVHVSSLASAATRAQLIKTIARFDRGLQRYRTIKIAGVAPGFPRLYLAEIMGALRMHVSNISIAASADEPDVAGLVNAGASVLGFTLSDKAIGPNTSIVQPNLLARIRNACNRAHASGKSFFVEGAFGRELAMQIRACGVDYLSTPEIWAPCKAPVGAARWSSDRLLAQAA